MNHRPPEILAPAKQDLTDIWSYLAVQASPAIADRMLNRLYAKFDILAAAPLIGSPHPDLPGGFRSAVVAPYVIFYQPLSGRVQIWRVLHGARDHGALMKPG